MGRPTFILSAMEFKSGNQDKISFLQYLNTVILTAVAIVLTILCTAVVEVKTNQENTAISLGIVKSRQDMNMIIIDKQGNAIEELQKNSQETLRKWVDDNYVRKPQSK